MLRFLQHTYFLVFALLAQAAWALDANEILSKADEIRSPSASFVMEVTIKSGDELSRFEVALKGKDKTMIRTLAPPRDKGRNLLMLGDDMWAYVPDLKRAIRVSLSQKLTGEAANGDIARVRWAGDYAAKIEKQDAKSWTLYLTATRRGLTYDKARVVVAKESFRPLSAEYLTLDGDLLKRAEFGAYRLLAGAERPAEIKIRDAARQDRLSVITIVSMTPQDLKDAEFQQANLGP